VEKCKAVGMDDYLSKPTPISELKSIIEKWMPQQPLGNQGDQSKQGILKPASNTQSEIYQQTQEGNRDWDIDELSSIIGEDPVKQRKFLELYLATMEKQQALILAAIQSGDTQTISDAAHGFKASSRCVGALRLGDICQALETAGKKADLPVCQNLSAEFSKACEIAGRLIKNSLGS
jgi:HPt (histidine-containing phosphotransfer) domain-containing protein